MCDHTVVHSAGSELLHPASTAAHKTAVPTIKVIFRFPSAIPFLSTFQVFFPDYSIPLTYRQQNYTYPDNLLSHAV